MPIVLLRVDERLIHGQVVVGWGGQVRPDRYVVVDAPLAASEWEQELYVLGVPERVEVEFTTPAGARDRLQEWRDSELRTVLLLRDLSSLLELARAGFLAGQQVNLGGLHFKKGKQEVLSYLFLDETDMDILRTLEAEDVRITAQDLPGASKVNLGALLE